MILYSIIPAEVVFSEGNTCDTNNYREINYMGEKVQVMAMSNNEYVITRILSTSPRAYLNPDLQPGSKIKGNI